MSAPGSHPAPPANIDAIKLPVTIFRGAWFRTHRATHGPLYFGKTGGNRFDAPAGTYGVLYLARKTAGAFIETFGHNTGRHRVLDESELRARVLSKVDASRPLRLVDLRGPGLARLGADAELLSGAYSLSQPWSAAIHGHPMAVDGIAYRARHDPAETCAAIFDRAAAALSAISLGSFADKALEAEVAALLDRYDYGI